MTDDALIAKLKSAKNYFYYKYRNREDSEDFIGYVAEQILNGRDSTTPNRILAIDYIRQISPYSRNERRREIMEEFNRHLEEEKKCKENSDTFVFDLIKIEDVQHIERAFVMLYYKFGLTCAEIGRVFGFTESHIRTRLNVIVKKLQKTD